MVLACLLFMKRMSDETGVKSWRYVEEMELEESEKEAQIGANERFDEAHEEHEQAKLRRIPRAISVFEITGPLFFGAADQISQIVARENSKILIVRMRSVPALDSTAMNALVHLHERCQKKRITLLFSHVNPQPHSSLSSPRLVGEVRRE